MVEKRTDRVQIQAYGSKGVEIFNQVELQLGKLVEQTAAVNYRGRNAVQFKTKVTTAAVDFGNEIQSRMVQMSEVVQGATTFIATALGGQAISLEPPIVTITMPPIDADESVEAAEDTALQQLRTDVDTTFNQISELFGRNLSNFNDLGVDGWWGPEYDEANLSLSQLTASAIDACEQARAAIATDITNQIDVLFG
jgi:hypothetical protein